MRKVSAVVNAAQAVYQEIADVVAKKTQNRLCLHRETISCRCSGHTALRLNGYMTAAKMLLSEASTAPPIFCRMAGVGYDAAL